MLLLSLLACGDGVLHLSDANNHSVTLNYDVPTFTIDEEAEDLQVLWTSVTSDLRCEPVDMAEPMLELVSSPLAADDLLAAIATNSVRSQDIAGYLSLSLKDGEPAHLDEMGLLGNPAELIFRDDHAYLLALSDGGVGSGRVAAMALLAPGGTDNEVTLPEGCGQAEASVVLGEPISLRRVTRIDWSGLTTDAIGTPLSPDSIDAVSLARAGDVAADYLALESQAEVLWSAEVDGITALEFDAPDEEADTLALTCSTCVLPVPLFLTTIED